MMPVTMSATAITATVTSSAMAVETSKPYNEQDDTSHYGPYKITFLTYPAHSKNSVDLVRSYKSDTSHTFLDFFLGSGPNIFIQDVVVIFFCSILTWEVWSTSKKKSRNVWDVSDLLDLRDCGRSLIWWTFIKHLGPPL